uniref:Uncharacterized protein n=1 Tax=Elizabethkingia anophelis TaxID=1117645 RepID=A0A455ZIB8_9FLAO|nr:TPA_exp: hypothetical protein [Elizabethkingia anophelis]DAC75981.1 TPA_exp: hypothetical protein [Elizabethkingia anophelis]DAC76528.1 TPA_exp: hypothetical protein [Elizabethkingia anophelis]
MLFLAVARWNETQKNKRVVYRLGMIFYSQNCKYSVNI